MPGALDPVDARRSSFVAVARVADVAPGPLGVVVLGTAVVLFRDRSGRVGALSDRCPHRDMPLSSGSVGFFGELVCGYHGWAWEADGVCVRIPASHATMRPAQACVRSFEVREVDGLVWVALERPAAEPTGALDADPDRPDADLLADRRAEIARVGTERTGIDRTGIERAGGPAR